MKALRGILIVMVFVVAATLFGYLTFVHPIGKQFVRGKVTEVVAQAKTLVKAQTAQLTTEGAPVVSESRTQAVSDGIAATHVASPARATAKRESGRSRETFPKTAVPVNEPIRSQNIDNPFKLEPSEFSRADIDTIIERRRRIKDKLGEL